MASSQPISIPCGTMAMFPAAQLGSQGSLSNSMSLTAFLIVSAFLILTPPPPAFSTAIGDEAVTAYDMLGHYHFPKGLLPEGVIDYELDQSTGRFRARLNGSCGFSLEGSYQLNYKSTISGYISRDKLTRLEGVKVKVLLFWFDIVEVVRYGDDIEFSVGIASASFPLENFFVCPRCGCGLNCDDSKLRLKSPFSVSSV